MKTRFAVAAALLLSLLVAGISAPALAEEKSIILATTTSTQDSGLLDALLPVFQKETGYFVKTIAVGSGQAMAMGQKGEADVLLVHSPKAEQEFMAGEFGVDRRLVMHNDFVILGPMTDPAGIRGMKSSAEAFKKIAEKGGLFMSRGDKSGTNSAELAIWKTAGVAVEGAKWYQQTGLGMGQTLSVSSEKAAYTLADRGTWLSLKKNLSLEVLVEGDRGLLNVYHVIGVNPAKWPKVNAAGGKAFDDFMVAPATQKLIGGYGVEKYGAPLFFPDAGKKLEDLGK
jgi:tungstate transport system substrate-binding protein